MRTIKRIAVFLAVVCSAQMSAQDEMTIAFRDSLQSDILNERRELWIHLPPGYNENLEYPVIYLLDGASNLRATVGVISQLANMHTPDMIIVAIQNTDRDRDMTPYPAEDESPFSDMMPMPPTAGGGQAFVDFMTSELMPYIEGSYSVAPYRIIAGHSMSGLLALYAAIFENELFDACIAVDPSIWWAKGRMLDEVTDKIEFTNDRMFIGVANTFAPGSSIETIHSDTNKVNLHPKRIVKLCDKLKALSGEEMMFESKYYELETHGSVPLLATYDGLRFIFRDYPSMDPDIEQMMTDPGSVQQEMREMYEAASETYGFQIAPDERMVNFLGYECMRMEKHDVAEKFFLMNVEYYPYSQNVYDSLGDCYVEIGKKDQAIAQYQKAMEIRAQPHTKEKLDKLLAE